ncbi:hypothetical protein [Streptomyces sp. NPDC047315]|uniref:hypothetical protein n=1 Tax=Streptomyces sp. NPDC047315 TaxID=3155142 RepID=UPI0034096729
MTSTATPAMNVDRLDAVLLELPYGQWIPMPEAAQRVKDAGIPGDRLTAVIRKGRRRGVLRTRPLREGTYVMRVSEDL